MTTQTLELNNIERKLFWSLSALLLLVLSFYLYSVASLTLAVIDRDHINSTAHELAAKEAEVEQQYLAKTNSITLAYAQSIGFREVSAKFADSQAQNGTMDSNTKLSMAR